MDKSFPKVYQKTDKGKYKIGSVPDITVKDKLPPPAKDTPTIILEAPTQMDSQPKEEKVEEVTKDDINSELDIIFTMNVDTQDFNIVMEKETTKVKKSESIPNDTQLNTEILAEAEAENGIETGHEQNIFEPTDSKVESKVIENKSENKEEIMDKEEVKDGSKEVEVVKVTVQTSGEEKKPIA